MVKEGSRVKPLILIIPGLAAIVMTGCVTPYQEYGGTGGYTEKNLGKNVWRVKFSGNAYTTSESVQTYWLYRCSELTMERGFGGFEILSSVWLTMKVSPSIVFGPVDGTMPVQYAIPTPVFPNGGDYGARLEADILLLRGPIAHKPPRVFDAKILHDTLKPYVDEAKKKGDNVKEHIHEYLYPEKKLGDAQL